MSRSLPALLLGIATCCVVQAHVVSVSTGEIRITGRTAIYELHMPAYEVEQLPNPELALLNEIRFGGSHETSGTCVRKADEFVCNATYAFDHEIPDKLEVDCTLFRITVPNHVHMLYAVQGANSDQVAFDQGSPRKEIRFRPPTVAEAIVRDGSAGALRMLSSVAGLLFLVTLVLAARGRKETVLLAVLFLAAQWIARPLASLLPAGLSPQFLEMVMALTVAYLAAEVIFLPAGRARWVIVPILGAIHGLPFAAFPPFYLAGAATVEVLMLIAIGFGAQRLSANWRRYAAGMAGAASLGWFARLLLP